MLSRCVNAAQAEAAPYIPEMVQFVISYFQSTGLPCLLTVARAFVEAVPHVPACVDPLRSMILFLLSDGLRCVRQSGLPQTATDYFHFVREVHLSLYIWSLFVLLDLPQRGVHDRCSSGGVDAPCAAVCS